MAAPAADKRAKIHAFLRSCSVEHVYALAKANGLFAPLSPLLRARAPGAVKLAGRAPESSLRAFWSWCRDEAAPTVSLDAMEAWAAKAAGISTPEHAPSVWRERIGVAALAHLKNVRAKASARRALIARLGDEAIEADFEDFAAVLSHEQALSAVFAGWPAQDAELTRDRAETLTDFVKERAARQPEVAKAAVAIATARLARGEDVVAVLVEVTRRRDRERLERTIFAPLLETILEEAAPTCPAPAAPVETHEAGQQLLADWHSRLDRLDALADCFEGSVGPEVTDQLTRRRRAYRAAFLRDMTGVVEGLLGVLAREPIHMVSDEDWSARRCEAQAQAGEARARCLVDAGPLAKRLNGEDTLSTLTHSVRSLVSEERLAAAIAPIDRGLDGGQAERLELELRTRLTIAAPVLGVQAIARTARRLNAALGRPDLMSRIFGMFEPMIETGQGRTHKRAGHIHHTSLDTLWRHVMQSEIGDALSKAEAEHADAGDDRYAQREIAARARVALATWLTDALATRRAALVTAIGARAVMDVEEVLALLRVAETLEDAFSRFPGTLNDLDPPMVSSLRGIHTRLSHEDPEASFPFLLFVLARLRRPAQILRLVCAITHQSSSLLLERSEFAVIGQVLLDEAQELADAFDPNQTAFDGVATIEALERFAHITAGMVEEISLVRDGEWGSRLFDLRTRAAERLEALCRKAVSAVSEATPRSGGTRDRALVNPPLDMAVYARAAQYAHFIAESRILDSKAAFSAARVRAAQEISRRLELYVDSLFELVHDEDEPDRLWAVAALEGLCPTLKAIEGPEASAVIERRMRAAA